MHLASLRFTSLGAEGGPAEIEHFVANLVSVQLFAGLEDLHGDAS